MNIRIVPLSQVTVSRRNRVNSKLDSATINSVVEKCYPNGIKYYEFQEPEKIENLKIGDTIHIADNPRKKYKIAHVREVGSVGFPNGGVTIENDFKGIKNFTLNGIKKAK